MHLNSKIITGLAFIILGGLAYINQAGYINFGTEAIVGITLVFYGLPSVYISLNNGRRDWLLFATVLFFVGIIFIVKFQYELIDSHSLVFVSLLFIGGAVFLILFIENTNEKIFLAAAIILMVFGYASTSIFKQLGILNTADKIANVVDDYWSIILVIWGLSIFLTRKK